MASYGTRFVVCDIRACHLHEPPFLSVLTPCDDRMLQSQVKGQAVLAFWGSCNGYPILKNTLPKIQGSTNITTFASLKLKKGHYHPASHQEHPGKTMQLRPHKRTLSNNNVYETV